MKKIILNFGTGSLACGFPTVIGEVFEVPGSASPLSRFTGQLPSAPDLADVQKQWQTLLHARNQNLTLRIQLLQNEGLNYSDSRFRDLCILVGEQLNSWLDSPEFIPLDRTLRKELAQNESLQIVLETSDTQLHKLPWHLWKLFEDYPQAALTFSTGDWRTLPPRSTRSSQPRILATFGHSQALDVDADLTSLHRLSDASIEILRSPNLSQLHSRLWDPKGWDIFFFAGHSQTQGRTGVINLNEKEQLDITRLKQALNKAIDQGLKIALFNSCDGLGLAQQLCDLQIPYVVVMREPVPDNVATQFLDYLLLAFARGLPFHQAADEARQQLIGLENDVPGASWLPVIWQNPTAPALWWCDLQGTPAAETLTRQSGWRSRLRHPLMKSLLAGGFVLALRAIGALEGIELALYDQLLRLRPAEPIDERIVAVEISQQATSQYGYPLPDEVLTTLIEQIEAAEPLAIGLDIHRAKPQPANRVSQTASQTIPAIDEFISDSGDTGYEKLLQQVENNSDLFLVCAYNSTDDNYQAPPQLSEQMRFNQVGFSDLPTDNPISDGLSLRSDLSNSGLISYLGATVRRHILSYDSALAPSDSTCTTPYSFSFQLAYQYLYKKDIAPLTVTDDEYWQFGPVIFPSLPQRFGSYQRLETPSSQIMLNYRANQPAQTVSAEQLLTQTADPEMLADRIVIIGYNSSVSQDYFVTPYGQMPGLWVHAHMVSQLLSAVIDERPLITTLPHWRGLQWGDMLWILIWACIGGGLGYACRRSARWMLSLLVCAIALYGLCWVALIYGIWLPLLPALLAASGASAITRLPLAPSSHHQKLSGTSSSNKASLSDSSSAV